MTEKTPLIMLPGLLCDAALWAPQCAALTDIADCRVANMTQDDSITGMAERVLADAPERFALAGLSMGGYCALEIMRLAPERIDKLALLDTSAEPDTADRTAIRVEWVAQARQGMADFDAVIDRHISMYLHPERLADTAITDRVRASARNVGIDGYARNQSAIAGRRDQRGNLAAINCPTLVLCGRQDSATPPALHEALAEGISGAKLVVIEDCGHLSTLERPDAVNAALRQWLEE
jgi:pimeloyl-ACP methyl ester carboxylesterase